MTERYLWQISDDLLALHDLLAESGGELSDPESEAAIDEWFESLGAERSKKVDAYCNLISEIKARGQARQAEAQRLADLADTDDKAVASLKGRLQWFLERHGLQKMNTPHYALSVCANGGQQPLDITVSADQLPPEFQWTKTTVTPDQQAIRKALDEGAELPFARYTERGKHLRIR